MNGTDLIREQSLSGVGLIEAGNGFRIGSPAFDFVSVARQGDRWTSVDRAHGLAVESSLRRQGAGVVIEHRLRNVSDEPSTADASQQDFTSDESTTGLPPGVSTYLDVYRTFAAIQSALYGGLTCSPEAAYVVYCSGASTTDPDSEFGG